MHTYAVLQEAAPQLPTFESFHLCRPFLHTIHILGVVFPTPLPGQGDLNTEKPKVQHLRVTSESEIGCKLFMSLGDLGGSLSTLYYLLGATEEELMPPSLDWRAQ